MIKSRRLSAREVEEKVKLEVVGLRVAVVGDMVAVVVVVVDGEAAQVKETNTLETGRP